MITLSGLSPAPGENLVALDSTVDFTLVDDGDGIDISTLIVMLKGGRAIDAAVFQADFDGPLSAITPSGNNFFITIDPETNFNVGKVYSLQIQVKSFNGSYFNTTYSFKTIPEEPVLVTSSPATNETLLSAQLLYLEFDDIIDGVDITSIKISINGLDYIEDGLATALHNGLLTDVIQDGTSAQVRVDPIEALKNGKYILHYEVADNLGFFLTGDIKFTVKKKEEILPTGFAQTGFLGFFQGIKRVTDIGCGDSVHIEWNEPIKKLYNNELFVLVYQDEYRLNTFDRARYLAAPSLLEATVSGLQAGVALSYGARALELATGVLDTAGMVLVDEGFFEIPNPTSVSTTFNTSDFILEVDSVEGYPAAGLLFVGREVMRYTAVDRLNNTFSIPLNGRGVLNSTASIYLAGDSVELFTKCSDANTVIVSSTPTFSDGYGSNRPSNEIGVLVTDYSDNDRVFFQGYDFCGWHDDRPIDALSDKSSCGSYLGGETAGGFRGFDLYDRMLSREEVLLDTTGEPVILLKRIWDGVTCSCVNNRSISPKVKSCQNCYGTKYELGFTQYMAPRREDRRIMASFDETSEDLLHGEREHLQQEYEPSAWTLPMPAIRDRDLIVRFDFTNEIEFIYEVLNVSREKIFNRRFGRQKLALKRLDKTDIVYTFPIDLSDIPSP